MTTLQGKNYASREVSVTFVFPITRKEAIIRQLREEIVSGRLAQGTLVRDAEIAARLGVSITPVREAITHLAAEGLIDLAPNRGRYVTKVTQKSALELMDVMGVLACSGVEWGVENLTETHLAQARDIYSEFVLFVESENMTAASAACADFSTILISASGNRELQTHVDLLVARSRRLLGMSIGRATFKPWVDGYGQTLELLERGDLSGGVRRYRQIYDEYRELLLRSVDFG
jgi:DNA-binding GntR family transcriptional regulator